ncbi:cytochrome P450 [Lophiotrema nucula]|uniref:Cytochrome P450 n=1 Tax=Lophiotrema nucula TaxID=690887 RepID=A0A6A5ZLV1_9PLEO|nr:cytochrome P450 [Lophiotrema nucula]
MHFLLQHYWAIPIAILASIVVYQRFFHPLASVPGPFLASLTNFWIVHISQRGDMIAVFRALHAKHGPVVRVAPNEVSVADLAAFRNIYSVSSKFRKSDWYSVWQGHRKFDIFAGRDIKVHAQQRRLTARAFSLESLKELEPYIDNMIETFCRKMKGMAGEKVDMAYWLQLFAFDTIGEITWSKSFGYMEDGSDHGTFNNIHNIVISGTWLGYVPWLYWTHDGLMPYTGNWLGINGRHSGLRDFALKETQLRKDKPVEKQDMIGRFFDTSAKNSDAFSYNDVVSMGTTLINAGADTTAISTRSVIYHVLRNPEIKRKLVAEIDEMRSKGELSNPVTWEEANKMKYLQACIEEGIRVHPAVGLSLPRVVPQGGIDIAGHYIPEGKVVGTNAWVIHQNTEVFGEDADKFNPDRWLDEEKVGDMHRYSFAFGGGSRSCLGKNISWLEMSKLIPTMFLNYDIELWEGQPWEEECLFFVYVHNFFCKLTPRKDPAEL